MSGPGWGMKSLSAVWIRSKVETLISRGLDGWEATRGTRVNFYTLCTTKNVLVGLLNRRLFEFGEEIGKTVETIVADHASRLVYKLEGRMQSYYWKGKKEVDVVIKLGPIPIPIVVKYQERPDDTGGLKSL